MPAPIIMGSAQFRPVAEIVRPVGVGRRAAWRFQQWLVRATADGLLREDTLVTNLPNPLTSDLRWKPVAFTSKRIYGSTSRGCQPNW
jgi:hypothetical protein